MEEVQTMKDEEKKLELKNPTIYQTNENCQVFNGPISGCVFAMPGSNVTQVGGGRQTEGRDEELARRLVPLLGDEVEAGKFPGRIEGMKNTEITKLVNTLWEKGVIPEGTKPTDIWKVLHDLGYYTASDRNWNDQVSFTTRKRK